MSAPWFDDRCMVRDLPAECISDCTHAGRCDDDVEYWRTKLDFHAPDELARKYIVSTGAWDSEEVAEMDADKVDSIILWLATGQLKEGDDPFYLDS